MGILTDTIGHRKVTSFFSLIAFAGGIIFAVASGPGTSVLGRALIGAGVGSIFIPTLKIISKWYRVNEFAGKTGILIAIGNAGGLAATLPLTWLVLMTGWRPTFGIIGLLYLVLAFVSWAVVRDRPEDKGWEPFDHGSYANVGKIGVSHKETGLSRRLMIISKNAEFWMITFATFFVGGSFLTFQGLWFVPYLTDIFDIGRAKAGGMLMLLPSGFALGSISVGILINIFKLEKRTIILHALGVSIFCWASLLFVNGKTYQIPIIVPLFFMLSISTGQILPIYMTLIKEHFPLWLTGTAIGLMNPAAFLGTAIYQPFTGFLLDMTGRLASGAYPLEAYRHVFIVFLVFFGLAYVGTYLFSRGERDPVK